MLQEIPLEELKKEFVKEHFDLLNDHARDKFLFYENPED